MKYLELNSNERTALKNYWNASNAISRSKFIIWNRFVKKWKWLKVTGKSAKEQSKTKGKIGKK